MKQAILSLALLISVSAHARSTPPAKAPAVVVTAGTMAGLLSSAKTAACLNKLHSLEDTYDVQTGDSEISQLVDKNGVETTIGFRLISGGDIVRGTAEMHITQVPVPQFGFPNVHILRVIDCQFNVQLF